MPDLQVVKLTLEVVIEKKEGGFAAFMEAVEKWTKKAPFEAYGSSVHAINVESSELVGDGMLVVLKGNVYVHMGRVVEAIRSERGDESATTAYHRMKREFTEIFPGIPDVAVTYLMEGEYSSRGNNVEIVIYRR